MRNVYDLAKSKKRRDQKGKKMHMNCPFETLIQRVGRG